MQCNLVKYARNSKNVYFFIPNIIGYLRILMALMSFWFMPHDCYKAIFLYVGSEILDALDGYAARYFHQSSHFGAMLDMLTDRCCTLVLLITLCSFYPKWALIFQMSILLDICSHWIHIYSSTIAGKTHKTIEESGNQFMKIYYSSRVLLFCMCAGNELFYVSLYMLYFTSGPSVLGIPFWFCILFLTLPICVAKSALNLIQMFKAVQFVIDVDKMEQEKILNHQS